MKTCSYCKILVGGDLKKCPFCQSKLVGEGEERYFPKPTTLKISSFFYKLQMFIVWTIIIGSLGTEFILKIHPFKDFYISVILTAWLLAFEFGIMKLFKKKYNSARILTIFAVIVSLLILGTSYFVGYFEFVGQFVIPIIVIGTMISNFILAMVGQASNTLVYLLLNLLVGIVPYIVFL